ncbi:MAG: 16S rRNA (guanine(527)-N(7))-methyltransferase RsmG [Sphingomonas sp.]|nr:16S rRNA (guanine(527)-N(7))-methyltransferase RsmG [Sphingomonas sp.]
MSFDMAARRWVRERFGVSRETQLAGLVDLVAAEAKRQNLVSSATLDMLWHRHVMDSAQLLRFADAAGERWIDIGTGAGFPGLVIAILTDCPVALVEPRRRRADFLAYAVQELGLAERTVVEPRRVELVTGDAGVISARAVAPLAKLLTAAAHLSTAKTRWLLPKGRSAREEVAAAQRSWHGTFHVEQSLTDPESLIVIVEKVARR